MASTNIRSLSLGAILIQSGNGIPDHISTKGTQYTDLNTAIEYVNKDGIATWSELLDSTYVFTGGTGTNFTGGTVTGATYFTNGLTADTISATTYYGLPLDVYVTGGTYSDGGATFTNNTGGTFSVSGFSTGGSGTLLYWYAENSTPPTTAPIATGIGSIAFGDGAEAFGSDMFVYGNNAGKNATNASYSNFLGSDAGNGATNILYSNFFGRYAGQDATNANTSNFLGNSAGYQATNANESNFLGAGAGNQATNASYSNFMGSQAGNGATDANNSNFLGNSAGAGATYASSSNFIGQEAGYQAINASSSNFMGSQAGNYATDANNSNFFGQNAGYQATGASYSNFIGYQAGGASTNNNIGSNNIIIGTNISLPSGATNSLNIGGVLFGTGTYNIITGDPSILPTNNGKIGINVVTPTEALHVSGNTLIEGSLSATTYLGLPSFGGDYLFLSGGTVTGGTIFTNGLTANTFSATSVDKIDYIVFNTGTTSVATVAGTVYFDNTEKALSYNTSINQGVTVNLGQQNYIRVFNNSGVDIQRGKALEILSTYSGLPSVTLAINKHEGFNIIGVSAEIIPNDSEGVAITYGVISGLELTGMTEGSLIYASDKTPGELDDASKYLDFPLTARTNNVGYVVQTGTTTGKLFVNITNENSVLSLTDLERNVLEGNTISTGVFDYTGMTTASTTTFNVAPVKGWLVRNTYEYSLTPDVQSINYTGGTNIPLTHITSADSTYILINSGLTITQQTTFPTPQERRENTFLGKVNHPNRSSILNINNMVDFDVSPMSSLRDLWAPIRLINQGVIPSPNGANLSINTSAGTLWGNGINWHNNQLSPNNVSISGKVPASFFYRTQTGGTSSSVNVIDPRNYDVGGVITSVGTAGSNDATNQRIYLYPTGVINVLYGQTRYGTLAAAIAAIQSETFIPYPNAESTGILIGVLSVRNDIGTDGQPLTNTDYAKFTLVSKFGESFGGTGGLSTTTLQQAYDNSSQPEIVINSILDGLSIKNGTGNADNITRLLEGQTDTSGVTSFIRADGYISGTTFQSNGFIANSNGLTATTLNIQSLSSGTSITNLGIDSLGNVVIGTTETQKITVGENVVAGNLLFLSGDSKYYKVNNLSAATSSTELRIAISAITENSIGDGLIQGEFTTTGLTSGAKYWVGSSGNYTETQPTENNSIVRFIGTALSTTKLQFNPDQTYIEISNVEESGGPWFVNPSVRIITTSQSALYNDDTIICLNALTITIPTAVGVKGKTYNIKSRTNDIVLINSTGSETFDDDTSLTITVKNTNITIQSDNVNWVII